MANFDHSQLILHIKIGLILMTKTHSWLKATWFSHRLSLGAVPSQFCNLSQSSNKVTNPKQVVFVTLGCWKDMGKINHFCNAVICSAARFVRLRLVHYQEGTRVKGQQTLSLKPLLNLFKLG